MRFITVLFFIISCLPLSAQDKALEKLGRDVFNIMKEEQYALFPSLTISENATPLQDRFKKLSKQEKTELIQKEKLRVVSKLAEVHEDIYKKGIDWRKTELKNVYPVPTINKSDFKKVLVLFQDSSKQDYIFELYALETSQGFKLINKGISTYYFSNEADSLIKKMKLTNHLPQRHYDNDLPYTPATLSDTIVTETDQHVVTVIYKNKLKAFQIIKDKTNGVKTWLSYFPSGAVEDSNRHYTDSSFFFRYSILGKLLSEEHIRGNNIYIRRYHANGLPEKEGLSINGKIHGTVVQYYYTGQEKERSSFYHGEPAGILTRYNILGDLVEEKKYPSTDTVATIEDLKYFISFEEAFRHLTGSYEETGIVFRKPTGWYTRKSGENDSEYLLWSYKEQSFKPLSAFKRRGLGSRGPDYRELEKYYKPATLYSSYDNWSEDIIHLLEASAVIPDSLHSDLCYAYFEQLKKSLLENKPLLREECLGKLQKMLQENFLPNTAGIKNFYAYNYTLLSIVAQSMNNSTEEKRFSSLIDFPNAMILHGKRVFEECESNSLLVSRNALLLEGLQRSLNLRKDVIVLDENLTREKWYRNYLKQKNAIEFSIPEEQYEKLSFLNLTTRSSTYKDIELSEFLKDIKEKGQELSYPYSIKAINVSISNGKWYSFDSRYSRFFNKAEIALLDALNASLQKQPGLPLFFEHISLQHNYKLQGLNADKFLPIDSLTERTRNNFLNDPAALVLSIKNLTELDSSYYGYYSYKITGLIGLYIQQQEKDTAQKLLLKYMNLFGELGKEISPYLRSQIIQSAYTLENKKLADKYMSASQHLFNTSKDLFDKKEINHFNSEMLRFFEYSSADESIKKFYPEEYKAKQKREAERKKAKNGSEGVMEDMIGVPDRGE